MLELAIGVFSTFDTWRFVVDKDDFTDERQSYAAVLVERSYRDIFIAFECRGGKDLFFTVDLDQYITGKSEAFKYAFRVDQNDPLEVIMTTWSNSNTGGYVSGGEVLGIAKQFMGGTNFVMKATTWDNDQPTYRIGMSGSDAAIKKVVQDCGLTIG